MMKDTADTKASHKIASLRRAARVISPVVGGLLLIILAGCNIFLIVVSLITHDVYAYFEMDRTVVAYAILPFWTTMFVGGCVLLAVSGFNVRERIGERSLRKAHVRDTGPT